MVRDSESCSLWEAETNVPPTYFFAFFEPLGWSCRDFRSGFGAADANCPAGRSSATHHLFRAALSCFTRSGFLLARFTFATRSFCKSKSWGSPLCWLTYPLSASHFRNDPVLGDVRDQQFPRKFTRPLGMSLVSCCIHRIVTGAHVLLIQKCGQRH